MEIPHSWYYLCSAYRQERQDGESPSNKDAAAARRILLDVMTTKANLNAWFDLFFATVFPQSAVQEIERQKRGRPTPPFEKTPLAGGTKAPVELFVSGDPLAERPLLSTHVDSALQWLPDMRALRNAIRRAQIQCLAHPHWPQIED